MISIAHQAPGSYRLLMGNPLNYPSPESNAAGDPAIGCGIPSMWQTDTPERRTDPFFPACANHDTAYIARAKGLLADPTSKPSDLKLYADMLKIAGDNWSLRLEAMLYYWLARTAGIFRWPKPPAPNPPVLPQNPPANPAPAGTTK